MPRIHAVELEDQPWLPALVRDYATDYLRFMIELRAGPGPADAAHARTTLRIMRRR
jgi:hypothetical protein